MERIDEAPLQHFYRGLGISEKGGRYNYVFPGDAGLTFACMQQIYVVIGTDLIELPGTWWLPVDDRQRDVLKSGKRKLFEGGRHVCKFILRRERGVHSLLYSDSGGIM